MNEQPTTSDPTTPEPVAPAPPAPDPSTFDIYVRQGSTWNFHSTFDSTQRTEAVAEAERIDGMPEFEGVRVMKTPDGSRNRRQYELLIWMSPWLAAGAKKPRPKKQASPAANGAAAGIEPAFSPSLTPSLTPTTARVDAKKVIGKEATAAKATRELLKPRQRYHVEAPDVKRLVNKIILVCLTGVVVTVATAFMWPKLAPVLYGVGFSFASTSIVPTWVLFAIFFLTCLGLMPIVVKSGEIRVVRESPETETTRKKRSSVEEIMATGTESEEKATPTMKPEEMRRFMVAFLEKAIYAIKDQCPRLDAHDALGICLFIGGANQIFGKSQGLNQDQERAMLCELATAINTDRTKALKFCGSFNKHLLEPDSRTMIDAGQAAMTKFRAEDPEAFGRLPALVDSWQRKREAVAAADN